MVARKGPTRKGAASSARGGKWLGGEQGQHCDGKDQGGETAVAHALRPAEEPAEHRETPRNGRRRRRFVGTVRVGAGAELPHSVPPPRRTTPTSGSPTAGRPGRPPIRCLAHGRS